MVDRPPSIPELAKQIAKLSKRMQRIEDAVTAKGIKFVNKKEEYDYMPAAKVMDYVYELIGIRRNWRTVYQWIRLGLLGKNGKKVYLKHETVTFRHWYVRKQWVRDFLEKL